MIPDSVDYLLIGDAELCFNEFRSSNGVKQRCGLLFDLTDIKVGEFNELQLFVRIEFLGTVMQQPCDVCLIGIAVESSCKL